MGKPLRILPEPERLVETGPVRFGDDWPGLFIRGDNAAAMAYNLESLFADVEKAKKDGSLKLSGQSEIASMMLSGLITLLHSCNVRNLPEYQDGR